MPETETDDARDQQQLPGRWSSRRQWRPDDSGDGADRWRPQLDPGTGRPFTEVLDLTAAQATARLEQIRASYHPDRLPPVRERAELLLAFHDHVNEPFTWPTIARSHGKIACPVPPAPASPRLAGIDGAGYSSPEKRSQADWRVMPSASPMRAQVAPSDRALRTYPVRLRST